MDHKNAISILLADDDEDDRDVFSDVIHQVNGPILLDNAVNGLELISKLKNKKTNLPDLLFIDLNMPGKDGRECLLEVKTNEKLNKLPVIIFTTSRADEDVEYAYQNGADLYIIKPVKFSSYFGILEKALKLFVSDKLPVTDKQKFVIS